MNIKYDVNGEINASEIIKVFDSVGWNKNLSVIKEAFNNSYYILAYYNNQLVGFARALSDNHYYTGIYDVVVKPEFQRQGIAKKMMEMLVKKFKGTYIFISYTDGKRSFYEKCGFIDNNFSMWIPK